MYKAKLGLKAIHQNMCYDLFRLCTSRNWTGGGLYKNCNFWEDFGTILSKRYVSNKKQDGLGISIHNQHVSLVVIFIFTQ